MPLSRSAALRPAAFLVASLFALAGCGGSKQDRPAVVAVFPADGAVLTEWLGCIRVTYDEPVEILSDRAARVAADAVEDGEVPVFLMPDPDDPNSILIVPDLGGHFFPGEVHHLVVQQGAVVNADDHYALDEFEAFFTVGAGPHLFLASSNGNLYEVDATTGAQVAVGVPPAGTVVHDPVGADGLVWVWLDGAGDDVLGTFVPGGASVVPSPIALTGYVGTRQGTHLVLDPTGRTLYATARDLATNLVHVHRIDLVSGTETGALVLSPTPTALDLDWQPALDRDRDRLYVPVADGAEGLLAVVDLEDFVEVDAGPGPGVDALPMPDGYGDAVYDVAREALYVLLEDESAPGFVLVDPDDFDQFPAREPTLSGAPASIFATPDGNYVIQGVAGYPAASMEGLVRTFASDVEEGFAVVVSDDVGAGPEGSTRVGTLLRDPTGERFYAFADDGTETVLALFDFDEGDLVQVDLDDLAPGVQAIDLSTSAPGVVTGATTLFGACGL